MSTRCTGHTGGFVAAYADGPKVIEVGFLTDSGELVVVSREAFDRALRWIAEKEGVPWVEPTYGQGDDDR